MNYLLEIKQAKELLKNESYNLCSIQCGRVLESALRYLFEKFLKKADGDDIRVIKRFLSSNKKKTLNRLTLGELSTINEKTNTLQKLLDKKQDELKELNLINFKALVSIRNRATHDSLDDLEQEAGTDAHIIYGSALKILNIFSFIHSEVILEEPEVHKDKKDKRTKKRTKFIEIKEKDEGVPLGGEIELPKADSGDLISVCKNKVSGKYFIYVNEVPNEKASLVTPEGKIKILSIALFNTDFRANNFQ